MICQMKNRTITFGDTTLELHPVDSPSGRILFESTNSRRLHFNLPLSVPFDEIQPGKECRLTDIGADYIVESIQRTETYWQMIAVAKTQRDLERTMAAAFR